MLLVRWVLDIHLMLVLAILGVVSVQWLALWIVLMFRLKMIMSVHFSGLAMQYLMQQRSVISRFRSRQVRLLLCICTKELRRFRVKLLAGLRLRRVKLLTGIKADITHIAIGSLVRSLLLLLRLPHLPLSVLPRLSLPHLRLDRSLPLDRSRRLRLDRSLRLSLPLDRHLPLSVLPRLSPPLHLDRNLFLLRVRLNLGQTKMVLRISPVL